MKKVYSKRGFKAREFSLFCSIRCFNSYWDSKCKRYPEASDLAVELDNCPVCNAPFNLHSRSMLISELKLLKCDFDRRIIKINKFISPRQKNLFNTKE